MEEDIKLVEDCQGGDINAFGKLYDKYIKPIYRFVYFRVQHRETAEDLTGKVFVRALENIKSYRAQEASFSVWLYQIARNATIDHYRTRKHHVDLEDVWEISDNSNIATDTDAKIKMDKVREHMLELKPEQREIVMMRVWQGLGYREIAAITGKTEANCRVIYLRGINTLKDKIPFSVYLLFLFEYLK